MGIISSVENTFSVALYGNVRFCTYVRNNSNILHLLELCSRNMMMVRMTSTNGGSCKELTVTSAYLPYDLDG
jgi:hypothetical protein